MLFHALERDPAYRWLGEKAPETHGDVLQGALDDAAREALQKAVPWLIAGVAVASHVLLPSRFADPTIDEPHGAEFKSADDKTWRARRAWPLVLMCLHRRAALHARYLLADVTPSTYSPHTTAASASRYNLVDRSSRTTPGPDGVDAAFAHVWAHIHTREGATLGGVLLSQVREMHRAESRFLTRRHVAQSYWLALAIARRQSDKRALSLRPGRALPDVPQSADDVHVLLGARRELLLLRSHHYPEAPVQASLEQMNGILQRWSHKLPAAEARRLEKTLLHLTAGVNLRRVRALPSIWNPPPTPDVAGSGVVAARDAAAAIRSLLHTAEADGDPVALTNGHRRRLELLREMPRLQRNVTYSIRAEVDVIHRELTARNHLSPDEIDDESKQVGRADVRGIWLLARADSALAANDPRLAESLLISAIPDLVDGIPHLALRAAGVATSVGNDDLARRLLGGIPLDREWPPYLEEVLGRLTARARPL